MSQEAISNIMSQDKSVFLSCILSCSVVSDSLWPHGLKPARPLCPCGFSRQDYWSGWPCPPPGHLANPGIKHTSPHYRQILFHLCHQWSPRILEWVAYPSSKGSSWPKNRTGVSCIAGGFFTSWATRDAQSLFHVHINPYASMSLSSVSRCSGNFKVPHEDLMCL